MILSRRVNWLDGVDDGIEPFCKWPVSPNKKWGPEMWQWNWGERGRSQGYWDVESTRLSGVKSEWEKWFFRLLSWKEWMYQSEIKYINNDIVHNVGHP